MKKLFFVLAIAAISTSVNAQTTTTTVDAKPLTFSIGVEAALPMGDFGDFYSFGIGGSVQGEYHIANSVGITVNAGYLHFLGKTISGVKIPGSGILPIMGGLKYNIANGPYIHGQAGVALGTEKNSGSSFVWAGGLGYGFTKAVDAELKFQPYSNKGVTSNAVNLRVAYNF